MKVVILALLVLAVFAQTTDIDLSSDDFEQVSSWSDKLKAMKCITQSSDEVKDILKLSKDISEGNYVGAAVDAYKITDRFFKMMDNCKVLFCFGPSIQKCQEKHPEGCEKYGLIVYPKCKEGYTNWDCCVCATVCPEGFTDNGLYCLKPKAYGRGAGYALWDQDKCQRQNPQGCEKNGALYYPKCKPGFHNVGCCICSPNCPSGWTDIGISCQKPSSYGRGVGYAVSFGMQCLNQPKHHDNVCEEKKSIMSNLQASAQFKFDKAEADQDTYQVGLPDELKDLGNLVNDYADTCMNQNEVQQE